MEAAWGATYKRTREIRTWTPEDGDKELLWVSDHVAERQREENAEGVIPGYLENASGKRILENRDEVASSWIEIMILVRW